MDICSCGCGRSIPIDYIPWSGEWPRVWVPLGNRSHSHMLEIYDVPEDVVAEPEDLKVNDFHHLMHYILKHEPCSVHTKYIIEKRKWSCDLDYPDDDTIVFHVTETVMDIYPDNGRMVFCEDGDIVYDPVSLNIACSEFTIGDSKTKQIPVQLSFIPFQPPVSLFCSLTKSAYKV